MGHGGVEGLGNFGFCVLALTPKTVRVQGLRAVVEKQGKRKKSTRKGFTVAARCREP